MVDFERSRRRRTGRAFCGAALLAAPLLAGGIAGTVRGPDGLPRQGSRVEAYDAATGIAQGSMTTGADGAYVISPLPNGTYFVQAEPPSPSAEHLTGELFAGIRQNEICGARGTEVAVGTGTIAGVDFSLGVGASIRGHVSPWNPPPISRISSVAAYDLRGCAARASGVIGGDGSYELDGLPPGRYYLVADFGGSEVDRLYPNVVCVERQCDVLRGTPVPTGTTNADFTVEDGGAIAGTVTGPGSGALADVEVSSWLGGEKRVSTFTDGTGGYFLGGLPVANGYRVLALRGGVVAEVYPNSPCAGGGCNVGATGTGIDIPSAGAVVSGKDLQLAAGHAIRGALLPAGMPMTVEVFGSGGLAGRVVAVDGYAVPDLPNGNYYVRARAASGATEYWHDRPCAANELCLAPEIVSVSGVDVAGIDFALGGAHRILGTVRNAAGDPIAGVPIEVSAPDGTLMSTGRTLLDGTYATDSEGLPPGTYYVRTRLPRRIHQYVDRVWPSGSCGAACLPSSGSPVTVAAAADAAGIDFVLPYAGLQFFTVTPCRVFDSRAGGGATIATGVLRALRLEAACGIPGNAVAVSANVTVTSASTGGTIALWGFNLSAQPPTTTVSFNAGVTRAAAAVLGLSLEGLSNLAARGTLAPGGRYHLILDVNGYFAESTPP